MNQRIGYARVSTEDQHLDLQRDALLQAGCRVVYEEPASSKNVARPELQQCCKALRSGQFVFHVFAALEEFEHSLIR